MKSKKKLAWQSGNYCTFAEIELSLSDGNGLITLLQPDGIEVVPQQWRTGVYFGLDLLAGKLARLSNVTKTKVTITSFRGQPGDTTSLVVAYVTFHAIVEKLAPELAREFTFSPETAKYTIASPIVSE